MINPKDPKNKVVINLEEIKEPIWELQARIGIHVAKESGMELIKKCEYCGFEEYGEWTSTLKIDLEDWEEKAQPDIFHLYEKGGYKIITEKVKNLIENNHLTNIKIIPVEELESPKIY
jgi:hypothetical protein